MTLRMQVEEQIKHNRFKKEDAIDRTKWCSAMYELMTNKRFILPPPSIKTKSDFKFGSLSFLAFNSNKK